MPLKTLMPLVPAAPAGRLAALALPVAISLAGCSLQVGMGISADGLADLKVDIGIDRDLIDGPGPTCQQVIDGTVGEWLPTGTLEVAEVEDSSQLRCTASGKVNLVEAKWDGQSGRPRWSADVAKGDYTLILPFSEGLADDGLDASALTAAGVEADVRIGVTMPAPILRASAGRVEGATVHLEGVDTLVQDVEISTAEGSSTGRTWMFLGAGLGVCALLGALAWVLWRGGTSRAAASGRGRGRAGE
ncbi:hypothetical protein I6B53_09895 [Schaalia sp. 19OD2882]|uniref:hypothetical protein n=1 Tax=Schaalia sp. 19OD2882 TaxID=2794089 RepID=UPI001C1F119C|nr:hypothetical protein [Schaalia sp. 19OD2882]QWW19386.1 hypothetical protein I6B53_09895 [Schaalia sp. 19OD2882]